MKWKCSLSLRFRCCFILVINNVFVVFVLQAEESSRHLSRSDSRYGSLKRGQRQESHVSIVMIDDFLLGSELKVNYSRAEHHSSSVLRAVVLKLFWSFPALDKEEF